MSFQDGSIQHHTPSRHFTRYKSTEQNSPDSTLEKLEEYGVSDSAIFFQEGMMPEHVMCGAAAAHRAAAAARGGRLVALLF